MHEHSTNGKIPLLNWNKTHHSMFNIFFHNLNQVKNKYTLSKEK